MRRLKLALLRFVRAIGGFTVARFVTRRKLKILCYHGFAVEDEADFRPLLFMRPELFEKRMARLRQLGYAVLPLDDAVERLYTGTLPANSVAITIDDGFDATHTLAAPILAKNQFPASVYVTSYYVQHDVPIFRLLVQYLFWKTKCRTLRIHGQSWHLESVIDLEVPGELQRAQEAIIAQGEAAPTEAERTKIGRWLAHALEVDYDDLVSSRKLHLMQPQQLKALSGMGLTIELHTHRHRFPVESAELARREITENRAALTQWVEGPFDHFCYPSGEFHSHQFEWLDQLNVKSSTTCLPGLNNSTTPRHALRRFLDGQNIHELEFESALCGFSDLLRSTAKH